MLYSIWLMDGTMRSRNFDVGNLADRKLKLEKKVRLATKRCSKPFENDAEDETINFVYFTRLVNTLSCFVAFVKMFAFIRSISSALRS